MNASHSLLAHLRALVSRLSRAWKARPTRVLIVDDEPTVRRLVDQILREGGYATAVAADGQEALEIAKEGAPIDLLVTDLIMPRMDGYELARRLRQADPALKVLYLTAYSDQLFNQRATLWEDEAFLDKPSTVGGLVEAVALLLTGHPRPTFHGDL